jgi:hypothetical protein
MLPNNKTVREYLDTHLGMIELNHTYESVYDNLKNQGFYPVPLKRAKWDHVNDWATKNIGFDNFNWTSSYFGFVFWFQTEKDAVLCRLRWS